MAKRPPFTTIGFPKRRDSRRLGWTVSVVMHVVVLLLLLLPQLFGSAEATESTLGAGGPGPAGGGGGGTGGTGGSPEALQLQERLQYIQVTPEAPQPVVEEEPIVPPPEEPEPEPIPDPVIAPPTITQVTNVLPAPAPAVITGIGGGTGSDGTSGTGPGSGGGVGSGIGTGRGTGVGPGTGGGDGEIYPPTPNHFFIPPLPAPDRVKGFQLVARFEVDEKGRARLLGFNPTPDRDYNRKLREALERLRWRPAVRADGTPVRQRAAIHYSF